MLGLLGNRTKMCHTIFSLSLVSFSNVCAGKKSSKQTNNFFLLSLFHYRWLVLVLLLLSPFIDIVFAIILCYTVHLCIALTKEKKIQILLTCRCVVYTLSVSIHFILWERKRKIVKWIFICVHAQTATIYLLETDD